MNLNVIVVDNSADLKERLTRILNSMDGITVCGSFDDAVAAMQYIEDHPLDLVFSDVVMPEISGITLASRGGPSVGHSRILPGGLENPGLRFYHQALYHSPDP